MIASSRCMNSVPGEMQFESNEFDCLDATENLMQRLYVLNKQIIWSCADRMDEITGVGAVYSI